MTSETHIYTVRALTTQVVDSDTLGPIPDQPWS